MGFENEAQEVKGQAEEALGEATGNEKLVAEGKGDQFAAKAKEGFENLKENAGDAAAKAKDAASNLFGGNKDGDDTAAATDTDSDNS